MEPMPFEPDERPQGEADVVALRTGQAGLAAFDFGALFEALADISGALASSSWNRAKA